MSSTTFYAVYKGRKTGVYQTWSECEKQVKEYKRPLYKKFNNYEQAKYFSEKGKILAPGFDPETETEIKDKKKRESKVLPKDIYLEPKKNEIVVYSDGASSFNGKPNVRAGYGVYFPMAHGLNSSRRLKVGPRGELPSNQRAELMGCIEAIKIINEHYGDNTGILLITDSKYSLQCVYPHENKYGKISQAWAVNWVNNGWINSSKMPVKNKDLIEELFDLVQTRNLDPDSMNVRFLHVRGHKGIKGNEEADKLAVAGKNKEL